jgi:hypothetical protein
MESQAKLVSVLDAEEGLLAKFLYRTGKVWLVYSSKSRRGYFAQGHKVDLNWSKGVKIAHRLIERIETLKVSLSATLSRHTSLRATVTPSGFKHARFSRSEPKQATTILNSRSNLCCGSRRFIIYPTVWSCWQVGVERYGGDSFSLDCKLRGICKECPGLMTK